MKIEPGDKVLFRTSPKHVGSGIVEKVDGEYVDVRVRKGSAKFTREFYRSEIVSVIAKGSPA